MTEFEKYKVLEFREKGMGYTKISNELNISVNTIKSFCRRHSKTKLEENPQFRVAPEQLLSTPKDMKSVTVGPSADFYYAIMNGVGDMLKNDKDVSKATEDISSSLQALLDQYKRNNI